MSARTGPHGVVAPGYESVRAQFAGLLEQRPGWSGSVCAYAAGRCVVDLGGGPAWGPDRLDPVYSCGKGAAAIALLGLVEAGDIDLEAPTATYWPEFAAHGKGRISVGDTLAHRAGIPHVPLTISQLLAHAPAAALVADARPAWPPGRQHGYHPVTIGVIADEIVRRVANQTLGELYESQVRRAAEIELFFGVEDSLRRRVGAGRWDAQRAALPIQPHPALQPELMESALRELSAVDEQPEAPGFHDGALLAINGVGTARGLACLYGACVSTVDGVRLLSDATLSLGTATRSDGWDQVLPMPSTFGVLFQVSGAGILPQGTFGHDGAAGSIGLGSRRGEIGFGFVSDHRPPPMGADPAALTLYAAVAAVATTEEHA